MGELGVGFAAAAAAEVRLRNSSGLVTVVSATCTPPLRALCVLRSRVPTTAQYSCRSLPLAPASLQVRMSDLVWMDKWESHKVARGTASGRGGGKGEGSTAISDWDDWDWDWNASAEAHNSIHLEVPVCIARINDQQRAIARRRRRRKMCCQSAEGHTHLCVGVCWVCACAFVWTVVSQCVRRLTAACQP